MRCAPPKPKRRTGTAVRRDGREPLGLGAAIGMMMTERGMAAPAAGGSVLAAFDAILAASVPEFAGRVQAVAFDADTGRLDVVSAAPAVGTKLRWSAPKLIAAANGRVPDANVRSLRALAPAPVKTGPTATAAAPALPAVPVERRPPPDGYRRAIEAHRQAAPPSRVRRRPRSSRRAPSAAARPAASTPQPCAVPERSVQRMKPEQRPWSRRRLRSEGPHEAGDRTSSMPGSPGGTIIKGALNQLATTPRTPALRAR
ncbi:DUF721 domain-containing protein [Streptomyces rimosus]|uniref:DUF721 domain-containing protein n=1 Tax=Streptomyces rimosus TaxID=1927 RepID=UPI0037D95CD4